MVKMSTMEGGLRKNTRCVSGFLAVSCTSVVLSSFDCGGAYMVL